MSDIYKETVLIYTGSIMIAKGLSAMLSDMGIVAIERNDTATGNMSGFSMGLLDQVRLYIRQDELDRAKDQIQAYLDSLDSEE